MASTVCGNCGIPVSWPDVYRCGGEHGEMTRDDRKLVDRREIAEMYDLTESRVGQFAIGHWVGDRVPFPEPAQWRRGTSKTGWICYYRIIDVKAWGFRYGLYSED